MFIFKGIQIPLLVLYILTLCWHPSLSEFTAETCQQLNVTENITCTNMDTHITIVFNNEDHFKIYVSSDYQSFTFSCLGAVEDMLKISDNLSKSTFGRLPEIIIDGCIPFENIFKQLGISIGTTVKVQRGATSTPLVRSHLTSLAPLTSFILSGFSALEEDVLADLENLETLELTRFEAAMPSALLAPISARLTHLHMRENRMRAPPKGIFATLQRLEALDLSFNQLSVVTAETFEHLSNLTELDLSNNKLTQLPANVFQSLHKLQLLYLSNNRLTQLELGTFGTLSNLQHLEIENNALDFSATIACTIFDGLTKLEYLELSNNSLSVYCLPHHMGSVRVKLSNNQINALLVQTGEIQPRQLANLNVRNNRLENLNNIALQYLHDSLAELSLAHNPWKCDCESVLWLDFIKLNHKRVSDLEELSCADGKSVGQVSRLTSGDVCKSLPQWYYLVAIGALAFLAMAALIAALVYRCVAQRNLRKANTSGTAASELSDLEKKIYM